MMKDILELINETEIGKLLLLSVAFCASLVIIIEGIRAIINKKEDNEKGESN